MRFGKNSGVPGIRCAVSPGHTEQRRRRCVVECMHVTGNGPECRGQFRVAADKRRAELFRTLRCIFGRVFQQILSPGHGRQHQHGNNTYFFQQYFHRSVYTVSFGTVATINVFWCRTPRGVRLLIAISWTSSEVLELWNSDLLSNRPLRSRRQERKENHFF